MNFRKSINILHNLNHEHKLANTATDFSWNKAQERIKKLNKELKKLNKIEQQTGKDEVLLAQYRAKLDALMVAGKQKKPAKKGLFSKFVNKITSTFKLSTKAKQKKVYAKILKLQKRIAKNKLKLENMVDVRTELILQEAHIKKERLKFAKNEFFHVWSGSKGLKPRKQGDTFEVEMPINHDIAKNEDNINVAKTETYEAYVLQSTNTDLKIGVATQKLTQEVMDRGEIIIKIDPQGTQGPAGYYRDTNHHSPGKDDFDKSKNDLLRQLNLMFKQYKDLGLKVNLKIGGHSLGAGDAQRLYVAIMESLVQNKGQSVEELLQKHCAKSKVSMSAEELNKAKTPKNSRDNFDIINSVILNTINGVGISNETSEKFKAYENFLFDNNVLTDDKDYKGSNKIFTKVRKFKFGGDAVQQTGETELIPQRGLCELVKVNAEKLRSLRKILKFKGFRTEANIITGLITLLGPISGGITGGLALATRGIVGLALTAIIHCDNALLNKNAKIKVYTNKTKEGKAAIEKSIKNRSSFANGKYVSNNWVNDKRWHDIPYISKFLRQLECQAWSILGREGKKIGAKFLQKNKLDGAKAIGNYIDGIIKKHAENVQKGRDALSKNTNNNNAMSTNSKPKSVAQQFGMNKRPSSLMTTQFKFFKQNNNVKKLVKDNSTRLEKKSNLLETIYPY